jgi:hypothetical protein
MSQFQTYPEDAPVEAPVWVAFVRFDSMELDDDNDYVCDSGRLSYVTTTKDDADRVMDIWLNGGFNPKHQSFSVRRGFVSSYPSLEDEDFVDVMHACDDIGWSDDIKGDFIR